METVSTKYEDRVVFGRVVNSIKTPFNDVIYKVELDSWIVNKNQQLIEFLYLNKNELNLSKEGV